MRAQFLPLLPALLSGCPFIFGAPDLGLVVEPPTGTDSATTLDPDVETADSGGPLDTADPVGAPAVEVTAHMRLDSVELRFTVRDLAGDPDSATVAWVGDAGSADPVPLTDLWEPSTGEGTWPLAGVPLDCEQDSLSLAYTLTVTDGGGRSGSADDTLDVEVRDLGGVRGGGAVDLGTVTAPSILCGRMREEDSQDRWTLTHAPGGDWSFTVEERGTTEEDDDLTFALSDDGSTVFDVTEADARVTEGPVALTAGIAYDLLLARNGDNESEPRWRIVVHEP